MHSPAALTFCAVVEADETGALSHALLMSLLSDMTQSELNEAFDLAEDKAAAEDKAKAFIRSVCNDLPCL